MNNDFGKILSFLRKGKGLSQKKVAEDLKISQALLSHYEKGIRECGLDFLIKVADYFEVSTDYLLGRTLTPNGVNTQIEETDISDTNNENISNTYCLINKKISYDTTSLIYTILSEINSKKLSKAVSEYLSSAEYIAFRTIYNIYNDSEDSLFTVPYEIALPFTSASMNVNLAKIDKYSIEQKDKAKIELSSKIIAQKYSNCYSSLYNLIRNTEKKLNSRFKI